MYRSTYDNLLRGNVWAVKWGPLEKGDIADGQKLRAVIEKYRTCALMHFAAYAYVGESVDQPLLYYFTGTAVLLQTMVDHHRVPIVLSSSCATYGIPERVPIAEDHPQRPINPYGHSKLFVEPMLADGSQHRLRITMGCPALFQRRGGRSSRRNWRGTFSRNPSNSVGSNSSARWNAGPYFGDDYGTPDGSCVRDYVHVSDIAEAHVQALEYLLNGGDSCTLNLANARGYSVKEVIATAERVCQRTIRSETVTRRPGDPLVLIGNASRAHALLGWKPTRSNLEVQMADAWTWMRAQG
jgi:UDP-arabinose 4-epimerase